MRLSKFGPSREKFFYPQNNLILFRKAFYRCKKHIQQLDFKVCFYVIRDFRQLFCTCILQAWTPFAP